MDVRAMSRARWDRQVVDGNRWTVPVGPEVVAAARRGEWSIVVTENAPVPRGWFPPLEGADTLGLACGGGQQGPVLAAAGANVTIFDNSPRQLERDREVAEREGLTIRTVEGDMADLGAFEDDSFDLIVHPVSNVFVPDVLPVWREAARVMRPGGVLIAGFMNPCAHLFDYDEAESGRLVVRYRLPFDSTELSDEERQRIFGDTWPLEFSHSLTALIGGQIGAGLILTAMYEDRDETVIGEHMPCYIATRALLP